MEELSTKVQRFPSWTVLTLCDRTFPGTHNIPTYTPQIGSPWQTKRQIANPTWWWNEFKVMFWNMTEGFLAEAEMTPGLHYQGSPQHRWGFTEAGTGNRGTLHSLQAAQQMEEHPFQMTKLFSTSFRQLSFCFFPAACLSSILFANGPVWESSLKVGLCENKQSIVFSEEGGT